MGAFSGQTSGQPAGIYNASGTFVATRRRIYQVVGPASYASGGFQVDCSAFFQSITLVIPARVIITATGATDSGQQCLATESGANLYSAAKFQAMPYLVAGHTHTYDKANTPTGGPSAAPSVGADANHTHALTYTATASGSTGPTFAQRSSGSVLNDRTFEFLVEGVPL